MSLTQVLEYYTLTYLSPVPVSEIPGSNERNAVTSSPPLPTSVAFPRFPRLLQSCPRRTSPVGGDMRFGEWVTEVF